MRIMLRMAVCAASLSGGVVSANEVTDATLLTLDSFRQSAPHWPLYRKWIAFARHRELPDRDTILIYDRDTIQFRDRVLMHVCGCDAEAVPSVAPSRYPTFAFGRCLRLVM